MRRTISAYVDNAIMLYIAWRLKSKARLTARNIVPDPTMVIKNTITVDSDSPQDILAQESMLFVSEEHGVKTYNDGGIPANYAFYLELCAANSADIADYERKKLKRKVSSTDLP